MSKFTKIANFHKNVNIIVRIAKRIRQRAKHPFNRLIMKRPYLFLLAGLIVVSLGFTFTRAHRPVVTSPGFALVELYTSEGCSSCPPADKLVAKIAVEYKDKEVYVLAYHVDYWNHLGWRDVFSNPQYSQRQRNYADYLKLDGVYTPQAIVNGKTEFVGSEEGKMRAAIQANLSKSATADLALTNLKISGNKATLQYKITGATNASLVLAVIQKHAQTQVKAGENSGHMLTHINIVQKLQTIGLKNNSGNADISLPDGFNAKDWGITAFVQSNHDGAILAAQKANVDGATLASIN